MNTVAAPHLAVLDDETDVTQMLSVYLTAQGYRVSALHSGPDLMALMARDAPAAPIVPTDALLDLGRDERCCMETRPALEAAGGPNLGRNAAPRCVCCVFVARSAVSSWHQAC